MPLFDDIKILKEHYNNLITWHIGAITKIDMDIQSYWNEYFVIKNHTGKSLKLLEIDRSFKILKEARLHFSESLNQIQKKLDDIEKQEYAIINSGKDSIN
jgi:hypothetical protein